MADIVYNMDGQSTGVVRAWQAVNTSIEEMLRTVGDITPASVKAEAAQKSLGATAERWLKQMRTPLDDHLKRMQELQSLLQAGNITQHEYSKGIALSVAEMKRAEDASDTYGAAAKAVLAELATPQERHNARLAHLNELRSLNKLTEDQYAAAVDRAQESLDGQNSELQEMLRLADQVKDSAATAQEKYNQKLAKLDQLLKAGHISQTQYNRAVNQAASELRNASSAQDQFKTYGQQAHGSMQSAIEGTAVKLIGIQTAYKLITDGIRMAVQENVKFNDGIQKAVDLIAEQELKLQIQGGNLPAQIEAQMPAIQKALQATPVVDVGKALAIQTQAASSGFQQADVDSGAALDATLQLMAATNEFGPRAADPKQSMQSISMYLKGSTNQAPSADMILNTGAKLATIFKESDVQFQELEQLAKQAATLSGHGINESEQLASFAVLRDVYGADKGAMGLKGFVSRTATALANPERVKALKSLKLKPQDVDIAKGGDQLIPTLEKISAAMSQLTPEKQQIFLSEMYGEEVQSQAGFLLQPENIQRLKDLISKQDKNTILQDNVATFRASRFARNQGAENAKVFGERKIDQDRGGTTWDEYRKQAEAQRVQMHAEGSISGPRRAFGAVMGGLYSYGAEYSGFAPPRIEDLQDTRIKGDPNSPMEQAIQTQAKGKAAVAERTIDAAISKEGVGAELVPLLKQIAQNTGKPPVVVKKPISQPTKTPKSAALAAPGGR